MRQHTPACVSIRQHTSKYVSTCQDTSGYVRIRQHTSKVCAQRLLRAGGESTADLVVLNTLTQHTSAYVSIRQHTALTKVLQNLKFVVLKSYTTCIAVRRLVCAAVAAAGRLVVCAASSVAVGRRDSGHLLTVSIRQHTSAYVSIRQHTSAFVSIRQHTSTRLAQLFALRAHRL